MQNQLAETSNPAPQKIPFLSRLSGSGILGGVGNIASNIINAIVQKRSQTAQNEANMRLAKYQYDAQKQMYDKANLYNTPAEQMARFKSAGLNPNLIYGQGSSGNSPNVLPQYHSPDISARKFSPVNPSETIQSVISLETQKQALKNMKTQGEVLQADRDIKTTQASNMAEYWFKKLNEMFYRQQDLQHGLGVKYNIWAGNTAYQDAVKSGSAYQKAMSEIARNRTMLGVYNSQIALNEKRKELAGMDLQYYLPNYLRSQSGLWGNIAKSLYGAKSWNVGVMDKKTFEQSLNRPNHYQGW